MVTQLWSFKKPGVDQLLQIKEIGVKTLLSIQEKSIVSAWFLSFSLWYTVDRLGKLVVAGGAAVGLGALCYYGMGMSSEIGAIERAA